MTLDQIKADPRYPFRRFREDDEEFRLLERYWVALLHDVVGPEIAACWELEFPADREEGSSILCHMDWTASPPRRVRVIQRVNEDGLPELDLGADAPLVYGGRAYVPFAVDITRQAMDSRTLGPAEELWISSEATPACERLCRRFLAAWCIEEVSEAEMHGLTRAYWSEEVKPRLRRVGGEPDDDADE